ncbi:hypothetical protein RB195_004487 [Necator americanus]
MGRGPTPLRDRNLFLTCSKNKSPEVKKRIVGKSIILSASDNLSGSLQPSGTSENKEKQSDSSQEKKP